MTATEQDSGLVRSIFERASTDLAMIIDRDLVVGEVECDRTEAKAPAPETTHISFRLEFRKGEETSQGCVLVPLPDAISVASYLMVLPDASVQKRRESTDLDRSTKDALLEVSNFLGGSADQVLQDAVAGAEVSVRSAGCQGVAADALANFEYAAGTELLVGRVSLTLHDYPSFQAIVMLPGEIAA